MTAFVTAGAGFLLAVLWFDLMFDVQVLGRRGRDASEEVLASIAAYYGRVTAGARPMNLLVGVAMAGTIAALIVQVARADSPGWAGWASLILAAGPILLATAHTFPAARRLGARTEAIGVQRDLARSICRDHLLCVAAITGLLVVQLGFAR